MDQRSASTSQGGSNARRHLRDDRLPIKITLLVNFGLQQFGKKLFVCFTMRFKYLMKTFVVQNQKWTSDLERQKIVFYDAPRAPWSYFLFACLSNVSTKSNVVCSRVGENGTKRISLLHSTPLVLALQLQTLVLQVDAR